MDAQSFPVFSFVITALYMPGGRCSSNPWGDTKLYKIAPHFKTDEFEWLEKKKTALCLVKWKNLGKSIQNICHV